MIINPYKALIVELEELTQKAFELKIWIALPEVECISFKYEYNLNGEIEDFYAWGLVYGDESTQSYLNKLNKFSQGNLDIDDWNTMRTHSVELAYLKSVFDFSVVHNYYESELKSKNILTLERPEGGEEDLRTVLLETQVQIANILSKLQTL